MRKYLVLILGVVISLKSSSQTIDSCGTPEMDTTEFYNQPWVGNNQLLEDFLDSIGYNNTNQNARIIGKPNVIFWIPIKLWIYRRSDGTGGPDLNQIGNIIRNLNNLYNRDNDTRIGFYLKCAASFINSDQHFDKTQVGANILMTTNRDIGCINIHIVNSIGGNVSGIGLSPLNACIVDNESWNNNGTII